MSEILLRIGFAVGIIALGFGLYGLHNHRLLAAAWDPASLLPKPAAGCSTIVCFTAADCAPCKTVQRPALERVTDQLGDAVRVVEIDAQDRPDLARKWGVLGVPTIFLIDARGEARFVHHGLTRAETLIRQINSLKEV